MTARVIELASARAVEEAWQRYCALVNEQRANDGLRTDARHQQSIAIAWAKWRRLYLMTEHGG